MPKNERFPAGALPASRGVHDGFANDGGTPNTETPEERMVLEFTETALGSKLSAISYCKSFKEMDQLIEMGQVEGMREAMGQMDDVLADLASFAAGNDTEVQLIDDTQARVARVVRGSVPQLWQAFTDEALLRRWQLGPDGWEMTVCEVGAVPGAAMHTEWRHVESGESFGFVGVVVEAAPPHRLVTTERMVSPADPEGAASAETLNELTFTPVAGGTLASYLITYPSEEIREMVLATGMADGMEASFKRLENEVFA